MWSDRQITAGTEWATAIDKNLERADVILLLVSADFLASDYCYSVEMKRALTRHNDNTACVVPIIVRAVDWTGSNIGKLQAVPKDGRPVTSWSNQDEAWTNVAKEIRRTAQEILDSPLKAGSLTSGKTAGK